EATKLFPILSFPGLELPMAEQKITQTVFQSGARRRLPAQIVIAGIDRDRDDEVSGRGPVASTSIRLSKTALPAPRLAATASRNSCTLLVEAVFFFTPPAYRWCLPRGRPSGLPLICPNSCKYRP